MKLPDFLTEHAHGAIRLTGHRIGLLHVVDRYSEGATVEMIACHYPTLSLAQIHKVIAFYLENQAEVDRYIADCHAEIEKQRAEAQRAPGYEELRRRMETWIQARKP